jgi:DNA-directed RNA polymerase subunit M/transcription elongation factor TFIIS
MGDIMQLQNNYSNCIPLPIDPFYSKDYNSIRRLKCIIISNTLGQYDEYNNLPYSDKVEILMRIENSCTNEAIRIAGNNDERCDWENSQFVNIYYGVCYKIVSILEQKNNNLINKIINFRQNINFVNTIASIPTEELLPEIYANIKQKINKRVNIEQTLKYVELHYCKKCKRNQTTVERVQNRSNDESSSFYITCMFCGAKWFK